MKLFEIELYKLVRGKFFIISFWCAISILIFYFCFVIVGEERSVVDGAVYRGYQAILADRNMAEEFRGAFTHETAERIVEKYGFPSEVEENYGGFRDENYLNGFVTEYLGNGYMRDWNDYKVSTALLPMSGSDLGKVMEKTGKEFPFDYAEGWSAFLDALQLGMVLGSALVLIAVSPVFAGERQNGMSDLLFTSAEGRERDVAAKVSACFAVTVLIYAAVVLCVFALTGAAYGFRGTECMSGMVTGRHSLSAANPISMEPVKDYVALTLALDFLGLAALCAVILSVSAHFEGTFQAVSVSAMVWLLPLLIRILFGGMGYALVSGTPLFLMMNGILADWYGMLMIPVGIAGALLVLGTISGYRVYRGREPSRSAGRPG